MISRYQIERRAALVAALATSLVIAAGLGAIAWAVQFGLTEAKWAKAIRIRKALVLLRDNGIDLPKVRMTYSTMEQIDLATLGALLVAFLTTSVLTYRLTRLLAYHGIAHYYAGRTTFSYDPFHRRLVRQWLDLERLTIARIAWLFVLISFLPSYFIGVALAALAAYIVLTLYGLVDTDVQFFTTGLVAALTLLSPLLLPYFFAAKAGRFPTLANLKPKSFRPPSRPYFRRWLRLHLSPRFWSACSHYLGAAAGLRRAPLIFDYMRQVKWAEDNATRNFETLPFASSGEDRTIGIFDRYRFGSDLRRNFILDHYKQSLTLLHPAERDYPQSLDIGKLSPEGRILYLPVTLGADNAKGVFDRLDFDLSDHSLGRYVFRAERKRINLKLWKDELMTIENYLGGNWRIIARDGATLTLERLPDIPESFPLPPDALRPGQLYLGQDLLSGEPVHIGFDKLSHTLVAGPSGMGKSVFLHQMMASVVTNLDNIEKVYLADLKYGLELQDYPRLSDKFHLTATPEDVPALIETLLAELDRRGRLMRENHWTDWPGPLVLIVIDEFADMLLAASKPAERKEIENGLIRLTNLSRALGFRFWVQSQKTTTDALPAPIRNNLQSLVSFRMVTNQQAAMLFGGIESLPADITTLNRGQAIYRDGRSSDTCVLQAALVSFEDVKKLASST